MIKLLIDSKLLKMIGKNNNKKNELQHVMKSFPSLALITDKMAHFGVQPVDHVQWSSKSSAKSTFDRRLDEKLGIVEHFPSTIRQLSDR